MSRRRLLLLALSLAFVAAARADVATPTAAALAQHVEALTAPDMEGRASGTDGGERAARYLADTLRATGLRPAGEAGSYFESFAVATGMELATFPPGNVIEVRAPTRTIFNVGRDWMPHGGSPSGEVTADVVEAGHGVVAPAHGWDDYAGLDVRGRIVMVRSGTPPQLSATRSSRLDKLVAARERGAAGLLLVDDELPPLDATATRVNLPSATIRPAVADGLRAAAGASVRVRIATRAREQRGANVVAVLPGTDPALAGERVVVGAHYDHVGRVGGVVHPGADDNASGTAVVLALARAFAAAGGAPRSLVFALFGGEELGLLGSRHHVRQPASPEATTVAMLNFDMVGRLGDRALSVGGVDTSPALRALVQAAARAAGVPLRLRGTPWAPSDHLHFYRAGAPVLFFTTGTHADYHAPSDTADKIDADGLARVTALATRVVERLAAGPRPAYVKLDPPAGPRRAGDPNAAFLGVMMAGSQGDGVRVAGVVPDTAAARLGLSDGDVLVRLADRPVATFADVRQAIERRRPGDRVSVVYLRNGEPRTGTETLSGRP